MALATTVFIVVRRAVKVTAEMIAPSLEPKPVQARGSRLPVVRARGCSLPCRQDDMKRRLYNRFPRQIRADEISATVLYRTVPVGDRSPNKGKWKSVLGAN